MAFLSYQRYHRTTTCDLRTTELKGGEHYVIVQIGITVWVLDYWGGADSHGRQCDEYIKCPETACRIVCLPAWTASCKTLAW